MEGIIVLVVIIAMYLIISNYYRLQWEKQNRKQIKESFGRKPEHKEKESKRIRFYLDSQPQEADVDEITWNDLSMDEVFWRVNNCASSAGEEILYDTMHHTKKSTEELEELEKSVQYFSEQEEERNQVMTYLLQMGKKDASYYIPPYMATIEENRLGYTIILRILQILPIIFLFGFVIFRDLTFIGLFGGNIIANVVIYVLMKMRYETNLSMLGTLCSILNVAKKLDKLECEEYFCRKLKEPLQRLRRTGGMIEKLQSLQTTMLSSELGVLGDYILGATLWQLTAYNKSIGMLIRYRAEYMKLYENVGAIDMAISIASFRISVPFYSTPKFWEKNEVELEEAYHPLIEQPVCNSMKWKRNCIITGSNASGKSTFIKAVAMNAILAQSIHTCMARNVKMPRVDVITSMAVQDDIMSGDSYFIKEIKYLKRMIEHLNSKRGTICIIDEILRGTNTKERIAASRAIMEYLSGENCLVMVASHDQELTVLLQDMYDNYHFSEKIGQQDITFDYKLYTGPATSNNAIRLLEYTGFPEKIIADAKVNAEI